MAKSKTSKPGKPAKAKAAAKHGPPVSDGIATAETYNAAVEASGDETAPAGVVTWPTEYGNPDMSIPPATPVVISPVDGLAVPVASPDDVPAAGAPSNNDADDDGA